MPGEYPLLQQLFGRSTTAYPGAQVGPPPGVNFGMLMGMDPMQGMLLNAAIQPLVGQFIGPNYMPAQAVPMTNLFDQYRTMGYYRSQQAAGRVGTELDSAAYYRMFRGASAMAGITFDAAQQERAASMSRDVSAAAPFLAMFAPDMFDAMHGTRGSAYLMARQVAAGSRYSVDPVTGARGLSDQSVSALTKNLYTDLFGADVDIRQMRGVSAGQTGQLYDEMTRRGLMSGGGGRNKAIKDISVQMGKTVQDIESLPDVDAKLRNFESQRTVRQLKDMAAAVAAMKDVFGENGFHDAPITAIVEGLTAITQNGMGSYSPEQIARQVRMVGNISQATGSTLEGTLKLTAMAAQRGDVLGLDRQTAISSALGGKAYADAYGRMFGDARFPKKMSKEEVEQAVAQLQQNAATSPFAQELAAVSRMSGDLGGIDIKQDTPQARLAKAIRDGGTEFVDADGKTRRISDFRPGAGPGSLSEFLQKNGVDVNLFQTALTQRQANLDEIVRTPGAADNARLAQGRRDIFTAFANPFASRAMIESKAGRLGGLDADIVGQASSDVIRDMIDGDLSEEDMTTIGKGDTSPISRKIEQRMEKKGVKLDDKQREALHRYASLAYADTSEFFARAPGMEGYKRSPLVGLSLHSASAIKSQRELQQEMAARGDLQDQMSILGRSSGIRRLFDEIQKAGPSTSMEQLLAATFNFVPKDELTQAMTPGMEKFYNELRDLQNVDPASIRRQASQGNLTPEQKKALEDKYGAVDKIGSLSDSEVRQRALKAAAHLVKTSYPMLKDDFDRMDRQVRDRSVDKAGAWWDEQPGDLRRIPSKGALRDDYQDSIDRQKGPAELVGPPLTDAEKAQVTAKRTTAQQDKATARKELEDIAKAHKVSVTELLRELPAKDADAAQAKAAWADYEKKHKAQTDADAAVNDAVTKNKPAADIDKLKEQARKAKGETDDAAAALETIRKRTGLDLDQLLKGPEGKQLPPDVQKKVQELHEKGMDAARREREANRELSRADSQKRAGAGVDANDPNKPTTRPISDKDKDRVASADAAQRPVKAVFSDNVEFKGTLDMTTGAFTMRPKGT